MVQDDHKLSTGVESVDNFVGGLIAGDNVVWEVDSGAPVATFVSRFADVSVPRGPVIYVSFNRSPQALLRRYADHFSGADFALLDCFTTGKGNSDQVFADFYGQADEDRPRVRMVAEAREPKKVIEAVEEMEDELGGSASYIFDSLTGMAELWHDEEQALSFFTYMCPRLYDLDTIAYWILETAGHSEHFLARLRHVTQVVIELSIADGLPTLLLHKAEGRPSAEIGVPQRLNVTEDEIKLAPESREEMELAVLREVGEAIGGALKLETVFEQTMDVLARELRMVRGTLVLKDRVSADLRIAAAHGLSAEEKERGRYQIGEGVTGRVVSTGEPVTVPDISRDRRFLDRTGARTDETEHRRISFVCVPLRVDGEVVGAISVDREFSDRDALAKDRRLLQIIASLVSQAIKIYRMVRVEREELMAENVRLRRDLKSRYKFGNIVAASGAMQDVVATAEAVAKSNATILVRGETGTGKELIASVLHYNSVRAEGPFIKVNCGALSENLLESELFGHVRGAFTGAVEDREGRFELADGGTIFLDEVGSMSERLQVKLLRVLQEREFERVGGTETVKVDVRVVAATNVDLEKRLEEGTFREDLYYRLNVIPVFIPPLRERREDIPFLVEHFLEKYNDTYDKQVTQMSREVMDALLDYEWPGNVRELESCIERAVVLTNTGTISLSLLPINVRGFRGRERTRKDVGSVEDVVTELVRTMRAEARGEPTNLHEKVIGRVERALLEQVLKDNDYTQTRTAEELGLSRNTVRRKIEDYRLSPAA